MDKKDKRVYHFFVTKSKEECLQEKSKRFADSYFSSNNTNAMAALWQSFDLAYDQVKELEKIAGFRPYRKYLCKGMPAAVVFVICVIFIGINSISYARCSETEGIMRIMLKMEIRLC